MWWHHSWKSKRDVPKTEYIELRNDTTLINLCPPPSRASFPPSLLLFYHPTYFTWNSIVLFFFLSHLLVSSEATTSQSSFWIYTCWVLADIPTTTSITTPRQTHQTHHNRGFAALTKLFFVKKEQFHHTQDGRASRRYEYQ